MVSSSLQDSLQDPPRNFYREKTKDWKFSKELKILINAKYRNREWEGNEIIVRNGRSVHACWSNRIIIMYV